MKTKRTNIFLAIFTILAIGFPVAYLCRQKEPTYADKTLTEWLTVYDGTFLASEPNRKAINETSIAAVKQIGANAIPFLLKKITSHETGSEKFLRSLLIRLPRSFLRSSLLRQPLSRFLYKTYPSDQLLGRQGFRILHKDAQSAAPALGELTKNPDALVRYYSLESLASLDPKTDIFLPILLRTIHDTDASVRQESIEMLATRYPEEADYAGVHPKTSSSSKSTTPNDPFTNELFPGK
jgi:hypothetical protein